MEHRLDTELAKQDRYSVEDGEADGLPSCWLCNRRFEPHLLLDGLLCPDCADVPHAVDVARLCRESDDELERHKAANEGIREAMRRAARAIQETSDEKPKITVEDIWG